jgi:phosphoribosylaminoimidazole (AIR) synthetase
VLVVSADEAGQTLTIMQQHQIDAWQIGQISALSGAGQEQVVIDE